MNSKFTEFHIVVDEDVYDESPSFRSKQTETSIIKDRNPENEEMFWNFGGQLTLKDRLANQINTNVAKNVILFIGDGMSTSTIAAARTYLGQLQHNTGEETRLSFEDFPHVGLSKVIFFKYISGFHLRNSKF